jgi:hypothetical protein
MTPLTITGYCPDSIWNARAAKKVVHSVTAILNQITDLLTDTDYLSKFRETSLLADVYYAYHVLHRYLVRARVWSARSTLDCAGGAVHKLRASSTVKHSTFSSQ